MPSAENAFIPDLLQIHHTAEDTSPWPALRQKVTRPDHVAVIDAMEAEHALGLADSDAMTLT
jgi:hypothetical protein